MSIQSAAIKPRASFVDFLRILAIHNADSMEPCQHIVSADDPEDIAAIGKFPARLRKWIVITTPAA
jgi:hypothetical protein